MCTTKDQVKSTWMHNVLRRVQRKSYQFWNVSGTTVCLSVCPPACLPACHLAIQPSQLASWLCPYILLMECIFNVKIYNANDNMFCFGVFVLWAHTLAHSYSLTRSRSLEARNVLASRNSNFRLHFDKRSICAGCHMLLYTYYRRYGGEWIEPKMLAQPADE